MAARVPYVIADAAPMLQTTSSVPALNVRGISRAPYQADV
jgi:hypothetical protein